MRAGKMPAASLLTAWLLALALGSGAASAQSIGFTEANMRFSELYAQEKFAEAVPFANEAIRLGERGTMAERMASADILESVAGIHASQNRYGEAEPLYERALAVRESLLGPGHPNTARAINSLARLYAGQGRYAKAEPLLRKALLIDEKSLGPEHPSMAVGLGDLALINYALDRFDEAEAHRSRMMEILGKMPGKKKISESESLLDFAARLKKAGHDEAAGRLEAHAEEIREAEATEKKRRKLQKRAAAAKRSMPPGTGPPELAKRREASSMTLVEGLEIRHVSSTSGMVNGVPVLVVNGTVVNTSGKTADVPKIRVAVHNVMGKGTRTRLTAAKRKTLPPGESAGFEAHVKEPPSARRLEIGFARERKRE